MTAAAARAELGSRGDFSSLSDRMSYLLVLRLAMGAIIAAWAVLRPEALGVPFATLGWPDGRLPRPRGRARVARRRTTRFGYGMLTGAPAGRRPVPRLRDVRHRRDAEPDPLPRLPRTSSRSRSWRRTGPASRSPCGTRCCCSSCSTPRPPSSSRRSTSPPARPSSSTGCRSSTSPRSGCSRSRRRSSPRSTSASCASAGRTSSRSSTSAPGSTTWPTRPPVADRARRPRRALRLRARRPPRRVATAGWSSWRRTAPRRSRPRPAIPTGSSGGPGSATSSCRSSGSTPRATRSCRRACPTPATSSSRR